MPKPSSEALLISALLTLKDADLGLRIGVRPEMFAGFQPEYRWLLSYRATYNSSPSHESFLAKFPSFPYKEFTDVGFVADEVKRAYLKRIAVQAVQDAAYALKADDLEEALLAMASVDVPILGGNPLVDLLGDESFLENYDEEIISLPMPWQTLQKATGGIRPGDLWYVAARLGQGKSWTLQAIAREALVAGKNVLFYSLEMPERQVQTRMHVLMANLLGVDIKHSEMHYRTLDRVAYRKLLLKIKENVTGKFWVRSGQSLSPANVQADCYDADLVIIDYVGLMASVTGSRAVDDWRTMASISNQLKEIAINRDIPIIAASQINREGDNERNWKPPKVKNLAQSDALGQDADVVITMKGYGKESAVYSVEKNRHGATGDLFWTMFRPDVGNFKEISRDFADDMKDSENHE